MSKVSLAKEAAEHNPMTAAQKYEEWLKGTQLREAQHAEDLRNEFQRNVSGTAGKLLIPAGLALAYGAGKVIAGIGKKRNAFEAMVSHAGSEYHELNDAEKARVKDLYTQLHKHSPTAAADPIAAWNHVRHFMVHPSAYGPETVEQLRKIESMKQPTKIPGLK